MIAKKKTEKKPVAKKSNSKPRTKNAKRVLAQAEGSQCFWVHDGDILSNLVELEQAFGRMEDDIFAHHVAHGRNDFADWVEFVLGDTELSERMRKMMSPTKARTVVVSRLKIYDL